MFFSIDYEVRIINYSQSFETITHNVTRSLSMSWLVNLLVCCCYHSMDVLLLAVDFVDTAKSCLECRIETCPVVMMSHLKQSGTEMRRSCHSCGNVRKSFHRCQMCPQIFCRNCTKKMTAMYGMTVFGSKSCPVCSLSCCCARKSSKCTKKYHCYRKCPVSRADVPRNPQTASTRTAAAEHPSGKLLLSCKIDKDKLNGVECKQYYAVSPISPSSALDGPPHPIENVRSLLSQSQRTPQLNPEDRGGYQNHNLPALVSFGLL